jgi:hypothetical protein
MICCTEPAFNIHSPILLTAFWRRCRYHGVSGQTPACDCEGALSVSVCATLLSQRDPECQLCASLIICLLSFEMLLQ